LNRRAELIELNKLLDEQERRLPAWIPMRKDPTRPGIDLPQYVAFNSPASIIGYGGSAGGGKSHWAMGMALMKSKRAIIYRKHYADFEKFEEQFGKICGAKSIKKGQPYMVKPPTGTRGITAERVVFGSLDNEAKDREKYQGRDHDRTIFDEVTQMSRETVEYLMGWNRSAIPGVNPQVLMTFNPPTRPEGTWIKDYFGPWLNKAHILFGKVAYGEILHRVAIPSADGRTSDFHYFREAQTVTHHPVSGKELPAPMNTVSITFIRAGLQDNLHLRETTYADQLRANSDPAFVRAMLDGDFDTDFRDGILSVVKPQHFETSKERYRRFTELPTTPPDVVAIDAAKGGEDEMVVRRGWRIQQQNEPTRYIYAPPIKIGGASVPTDIHQWEWLNANVPDFLDARLIVIDIAGGAGETIARYAQNEAEARHGSSSHVIKFVGGRQGHWRTITNWETGESDVGAMGYTNDITCAWNTLATSMQHTETCIPPDDELERQLLSREYSSMEGKYALEPKEKFSARLGRSPDDADAMAMCAYGIHRMLNVFGR